MPIFGRSAPKSIGVPGLFAWGRGDYLVRTAGYAAVPIEYVRLDDGYQEWRPSVSLRRFVECYWRRPANSADQTRGVTPDGCVDILLSCCGNAPGSLAVVGLMTQSRTFRIDRGQEYFGVRFRPAMAATFLPEAAQLTDQIVPLAEFWGSKAHSLAGRLAACPTFEEKSQVMNEVLRPVKRPEIGLRTIEQHTAGPPSLDALAAENGVSARQLRRVCVEHAGVPPQISGSNSPFSESDRAHSRDARDASGLGPVCSRIRLLRSSPLDSRVSGIFGFHAWPIFTILRPSRRVESSHDQHHETR